MSSDPTQTIELNNPKLRWNATQAASEQRGAFLLNLYSRNGNLHVRPGMGVLYEQGAPEGSYHCGSFTYQNSLGRQIVVSVIEETADSDLSPIRVDILDVEAAAVRTEYLYRHTSQALTNLATNYPVGATSNTPGADYKVPVYGTQAEFWFATYQGELLFGSPNQGTWIVRSFDGGTVEPLDSVQDSTTTLPGAGETAVVIPLLAVPNYSSTSAYTYVSDLPQISSAAEHLGVMVYASGTQLYFSDPQGFVGSVKSNNFVDFAGEKITCIRSYNEKLWVWTERRTYVYSASVGDLSSQGVYTVVHESVGCVGPNAAQVYDGVLYFVDRSSIYAVTGSSIKDIAADLSTFFNSQMENPITKYYLAEGEPSSNNARSWWSMAQETGRIHLAWYSPDKLLLVTFPGQLLTLCYSEGGWQIWVYESSTGIDVTRNIDQPFLVGYQKRLFMPCPGYFMEYGRGGALDRNSVFEDYRVPEGVFTTTTSSTDGAIVAGRPVVLEEGYELGGGEVSQAGDVLIPVSLQAPTAQSAGAELDGITDISFTVTFTSANFLPVKIGVSNDVAAFFPSPRLRSQDGWTITASGSSIVCVFDGSTAPAYNEQPNLNVVTGGEGPLFYLPFRRQTTSDTTLGLAVSAGATITDATLGVLGVGSYVFNRPFYGTQSSELNADHSQPVDFAYLSPHLSLNDQPVLLKRAFFRVLCPGEPQEKWNDLTLASLNGLVAADGRIWQAQVYDLQTAFTTQRLQNFPVTSQINRFSPTQTIAYNGTMVYDGNYIVADVSYETLGNTMMLRGQTGIQMMLYGWMLNKGSTLSIYNGFAALMATGSRMRRN